MRKLLGAACIGGGALVAAQWVACSGSETAKPNACVLEPPAAPSAREALLAELPKTDDGLPIVARSTATLPPGISVALVIDPNRNDAITRWSQCVARVTDCYAGSCGPITGCLDAIPSCADPGGGADCCPSACNQKFHALLAAGADEDSAVNGSYAEGSCVSGFAATEGAP